MQPLSLSTSFQHLCSILGNPGSGTLLLQGPFSLEVGHCSFKDPFPSLGETFQIPGHQEVPHWQETEQVCLQMEPRAPCQFPEQRPSQPLMEATQIWIHRSHTCSCPPCLSLPTLSLVISFHLLKRGDDQLPARLREEEGTLLDSQSKLVDLQSSYSAIPANDQENESSHIYHSLPNAVLNNFYMSFY